MCDKRGRLMSLKISYANLDELIAPRSWRPRRMKKKPRKSPRNKGKLYQ
jgi:hypothetical protein